MLTQARLKELVSYDPETGIFTWIAYPNPQHPGKTRIGQPAGSLNNRGYRRIHINGKSQYAHRLAWLYMTGDWPSQQIDHRNLDNADNRWANLREASASTNAMNRRTSTANTSGAKGVSPQGDKWLVMVYRDGKPFYGGTHSSIETAAQIASDLRSGLHADFARHN